MFLNLIVAAWALWTVLKVATHSSLPVAVVSSGSMLPALRRGDLVLLEQYSTVYEVGEVVVFEVSTYPFPFVHRITQATHWPNGTSHYLTKGDHNDHFDSSYYKNASRFLETADIKGRVFASIPWMGQFSLLMSEQPYLRFIVLAAIGLLHLVSKGAVG